MSGMLFHYDSSTFCHVISLLLMTFLTPPMGLELRLVIFFCVWFPPFLYLLVVASRIYRWRRYVGPLEDPHVLFGEDRVQVPFDGGSSTAG